MHAWMRSSALRKGLLGLVLVVAAVSVVGSVAASPAVSGAASDARFKPLKIVFFASATGNGYAAATWKGMQDEAKKLGGRIQLYQLDGNFNATTQFNQLENAASSHQYNGAVTLLNDTIGSVPAVKALLKSGTVVSNTLSPLGPNTDTLTPQVPGVMNVIVKTSYGPTLQAEKAVAFCRGKNPCRVVLFIGGLQYPFDKVRYDAYKRVLNAQKNIKVLALGQGNYDRNTSVTAMSDILQAHPKFDVWLGCCDQMMEGSAIALKRAGWNIPKLVQAGSLYIDVLGGARGTVDAVRRGEWNVVATSFPYTAGKLALEQVVNKLRGKSVTANIDEDKAGPVPVLLTTSDLRKRYPTYEGEFTG
jgi:ribose transport system substrate-binding protein